MENWSGLKAAEKAQIIQFAIKNGIYDINQIRDTFNIYARDGHIHEGTKSDSKLHIPTREEYITQKLDSIQNAALEASRRKTQAQTTPAYARDVYGQKYVTDVVLKSYVEDARNQVERLKAQERFRAKKNNSPEFIQGNTNTAYQSVRLAEAEKSLETAEKMLSGEIKYDGPTLSNCIANLSEFFPHGLPYGNETFSNNPKKYGFSLIDTWDVKPGDLVQKVDYSGRVHVPHHAMIYNGVDSKGEPTFNYSNGGMPYTIPNEFTGKVDTVGGYGVGKYYPDAVAKDKEHLWDVNVYRYTGTPQDSAMWTNEWLQKYDTGAEFSSGGKIHIAPSKRGTFTAAASKHGKSVQAFAAQVLAHKENYSPAMVKKANFARNAAHWHADGGSEFLPNENIQNKEVWLNYGTRFQKQRPGTVNIQNITDRLDPFGADTQYIWDSPEKESYSAFRRNPNYRAPQVPSIQTEKQVFTVAPAKASNVNIKTTIPSINAFIKKPNIPGKWITMGGAGNPAYGYEMLHLENSPYYGIKYFSVPGTINAGEGSSYVLDSTVLNIPIQDLYSRIFDYTSRYGKMESFD